MAIYGRHYGATGLQLALLGSVYSLMQFIFSPIWGQLSDKIGRRPILLMSLLGSSVSYFLFASAQDVHWLIFSRALGGVFAANISTAQAYIADITKPEDRSKGMGLIGAAFGIGFTFGPPIGGIAGTQIGLWAPGLIAGVISSLNLVLAYFRLDESLKPENRSKAEKRTTRLEQFAALKNMSGTKVFLPLISFFVITFAFSNLEQVFSLLIQAKFDLDTDKAAFQTGMILMWSGLLGALIQGGLIRKLVPKYGEVRLAKIGFAIQGFAMLIFSFSPSYPAFFLVVLPLALGSGLLNPCLNGLISRLSPADRQGATLGLSQGMASLARILGPFAGLTLFQQNHHAPFVFAGLIVLITGLFWIKREVTV